MKILRSLSLPFGIAFRSRKFWYLTIGLILAYTFCFNHVEPSEVGIARNFITGNTWLQQKPGWYTTSPFTCVASVDVRPMRVLVSTAGRGYSAKLVQFNPSGWQEFVNVEGFHYYWWYNRLSFNFGYSEEFRGMRDILRGHAYGAKRYSFIKVLNEYE